MMIFKFLLIISVQIALIQSENFQKDLDTNIQFPPLLERKSGIPTGHLRPLGWQIRSDGPLNEESVTIKPGYYLLKF